MNTDFSQLDGLSKDQLSQLLRDVKTYKTLASISHNRADDMFVRSKGDESSAKSEIQHVGNLAEEQKTGLTKLYQKFFPSAPSPSFVPNDTLGGGVRMYHGDELIEVSLKEFENQLFNT